jgi:hypothetical protein
MHQTVVMSFLFTFRNAHISMFGILEAMREIFFFSADDGAFRAHKPMVRKTHNLFV